LFSVHTPSILHGELEGAGSLPWWVVIRNRNKTLTVIRAILKFHDQDSHQVWYITMVLKTIGKKSHKTHRFFHQTNRFFKVLEIIWTSSLMILIFFQRAKTSSSDSGILKNPEVEILKIFK
jgi:hypothetical protein